jgi:hypothetical protein
MPLGVLMDHIAVEGSASLDPATGDPLPTSTASAAEGAACNGRCPITGAMYPRRQWKTINLPWPAAIYQRKGAPEFLCGIDVYHDFPWQEEIGHRRGQFPNGKRLAHLAKKECPSGKTPALLLTVRKEVVASKYENDSHFMLIVNIQKYLSCTEADVAIDFFVKQLRSRVTCLSDLEEQDIATWAESSPERMERLRGIVRRANRPTGASQPVTREEVLRVFKLVEKIDGELIDALLTLLVDGGVESDYLLMKLLQSGKVDDFSGILDFILDANATEVIRNLRRLNVDNIQKLNTLVGVCRLKSALEIWKENTENADEEFWQRTLEENTFVLSQVFSVPVVLLRGKAYVGGKGVENTGGNVVDFLLLNKLTTNAALAEIKVPTTPLLTGAPYRNDVYGVGPEVVGAVQQVRNDKDALTKEYHGLVDKSAEAFQAFDPHCLVVVGNVSQLSDTRRIKSFELFRSGLKDVQVITFDELFGKVETLVSLLEAG